MDHDSGALTKANEARGENIDLPLVKDLSTALEQNRARYLVF